MRRSITLTVLLALSACGKDGEGSKRQPPPVDPAITAALDAPLMIDPDLAELNEVSAAGSFASLSRALPLEDNSLAAIDAARIEAQQLVGGATRMLNAPAARVVEQGKASSAAIAEAQRLAEAGGCPARATTTAMWAARMPSLFPVYPRGAVQRAVGTDEGGCALRVVTFTTPAPRQEIVDFYYTAARTASFRTDHVRGPRDEAIGGTRGGAAFVVRLQEAAGGRTLVLLTTGGR